MANSPPLQGCRVVLGVTGGIAAYKSAEVCRRLVEAGAHVTPVMTEEATRFIGEVTLSALASEPVVRSLWQSADPIPHTRLGQRADVVLIVPATARFIGSYAAGISDGALTATVLATRAPVIICPAMHTEMWEHPAVQDNLTVLVRRGVIVVPPEVGRLAGGDSGPGRLADPTGIVARVVQIVAAGRGTPVAHGLGDGTANDMTGMKVVISAGGTREPIDPVRFITNRSSGKQGHALAAAAAGRGASVVLVTSSAQPIASGVRAVPVETAAQMEQAMLAEATGADVVIMAAAVADFRPKVPASEKLAKSAGIPEIVLEPTADILRELGRRRSPEQLLVGFAAETSEVVVRATSKLVGKGADFMVANDVLGDGTGFDHDTNSVTVLGRDGSQVDLPLGSKLEIADGILDIVVGYLRDQIHRRDSMPGSAELRSTP